MNITILEKIKIKNIPSGSGLVKSGNAYHIIGDDSPFLFSLNSDFELIAKFPLVDLDEALENGRIRKSVKPDFEASEMISQKEMVIFGSGSNSPERDVFIRVLFEDSVRVERHQIIDFYQSLKKLPIFQDSELNIEACAFHDGNIYLFNRKKNLVIQFLYSDLLDHIQGKTTFPHPTVTQYSLPTINGVEAGFSGATRLEKEAKIIFTASVEDTSNAYDDGEILGSLIGIIDLSPNGISESFDYCFIPNDEENLKVESVCVEKEISPGNTELSMITDDDKGNSVLYRCVLKV